MATRPPAPGPAVRRELLRPPEPDTVRRALECVPPEALSHDERARIGFAVFDGLGVEAGESVFVPWLMRREGVTPSDARSDWRSCCKPGAVGVGTLFAEARKHGFKMTAAEIAARQVGGPLMTAEQLDEQQQDKASSLSWRLRNDQGAARAAELWSQGQECSTGQETPYSKRKGVGLHGVRVLANGTLLVPMRDVSGDLVNVQKILPAKDRKERDKLFVKDARKSGAFHMIGVAEGAAVMLVAEGYATAASCHEATGFPAVVAFDAGNLVHVCRALRARWPGVLLLICADDDVDTERRTHRNPGRAGAGKARLAVDRVRVVLPRGLPDGGSDFNDLVAHVGADEVRQQIEAAIAAQEDPPPPPARRKQAGRRDDVDDDSEGMDALADRFGVDEHAVWYMPPGNRDPVRVCSPLEVIARGSDEFGTGNSLVLRFTVDGRDRTLALPMTTLAGDGVLCRHELLDVGFVTPMDAQRRRLLNDYLLTRCPAARVRFVDRVGWHGHSFVTAGETLHPADGLDHAEGDRRHDYAFRGEGHGESKFEQRGSLAEWNELVGVLCIGNTRLVFAVAVALAAPLLHLAGAMAGGGFHFVGHSSKGKTTALQVAASVYGAPRFLRNWRSTDNGLEGIAAQHSDGLLPLDEMKQIDSRALGEAVYMLSNGMGKQRSDRQGKARARLQWRVLVLSTGETTVIEQITSAGIATFAGQELRMVDIPAAAPDSPHGLFETLHGASSAAVFADTLKRSTHRAYGTLGRQWLQYLVDHRDAVAAQIRQRLPELVDELLPAGASGQARRVAQYFALAAIAGELATDAGLLDWSGESKRAAAELFNAWLEARPAGAGSGEEEKAIHQVRRFLQLHGDARFTEWGRGEDAHAPKVMNRAGFKRALTDGRDTKEIEWVIFPEVFNDEICKGLNAKDVLRVLDKRGHLVRPQGESKLRSKLTLPGIGKASVYRITSTILDDDGAAAGGGGS